MKKLIKKQLTYGDVLQSKCTFEEYIQDCYERNKDEECFRETNGQVLCFRCPKVGRI